MDIAFFGNERLASACTTRLPILNSLLENGQNIKLIVISEKGTKSRNKRELEVEAFAKKHNIELFIPSDRDDLIKKLFETKAEVGVLAAYGRIIPQEVIDIFPNGIINLHPSLLPKYRGPTPIESAILNGDNETGISIMALTAGMDSGPVYSQIKLSLNGSESKQELADTLGDLGAKEISKLLANKLPAPQEQSGEPTICNLIQKEDSKLDLTKTAKKLEQEIRAYLGWPGSKTILKLNNGENLEITVTEGKASTPSPLGGEGWGEGYFTTPTNRLLLSTKEDYLEITKLKLPGKNQMTTKDFLNGYKNRLQ